MRCVIPSAGVVIAQFDHNAQRAWAARYVNIISYPLLATLADRHPYDSQSTTYRIIGSCGKLNLIFNMLPDKSSIGIDRRGNGCESRATQRTHQTGSPSAAARTHSRHGAMLLIDCKFVAPTFTFSGECITAIWERPHDSVWAMVCCEAARDGFSLFSLFSLV